MSRQKFVIADTHFSQASMCAFANDDGSSLRPWGRPVANWKEMSEEERLDLKPEFERYAAEMDEAMVDNWNKVVPKEGATVYHLGDVAMKEKQLPILNRLHGKKKLILGNHDIFSAKVYLQYFYDVQACKVGDGIIMTHIPIHGDSIKQRWKANVHGHLHAGCVMMDDDKNCRVFNPRYLCVSVEQIGYTPLSWEDMMKRIDQQREGVVK
jgi:calcineurin-like phosphoesterase family protein